MELLNFATTLQVISTSGSYVTVCPETFIYDSATNICKCDTGFIEIKNLCVACSSRGNSTSDVDPENSRRCVCLDTFRWNDTLKSCVCGGAQAIIDSTGKCFSCAGLVNGTGLASSRSTCRCNPSFVFKAESNTCTCPD